MQSALNRVEGLRLPVTGVMDAAARSALRRFQRGAGLPVDGVAGPDTVEALRRGSRGSAAARRGGVQREAVGAAPSATYGPALPPPDRASRAYGAWLQAALNAALGLRLGTDGIIGPLTRSAIRDFQARQGFVPSGVPDDAVDAALMRGGASAPPRAGTAPAAAPVPAGRSGPIGTRFISIASRALLTPPIEAAAKALDAHFERAGMAVTLTSALRPPQDQLRLIRDQAIKRGIDRQYPSIHTATVENVDSWLGAWDELLHTHKYVINPPVAATSRLTGKRYSPSPHTTGFAFDLSGSDLDRIAAVVSGYCREGGAVRQILIERRNNAVHVGLDASGRSGSCAVSVSN
ncbi:MAG: peptidoglycan-binding protein [Piscinibacter sp.]|nr:peptidoglycan-binding protein [Piscinibacter sp.]